MNICKITAIIRSEKLEKVECRLQGLGVPGLTVTPVKGFGEYANLFSTNWLVGHAKIEIFIEPERADMIVRAIAQEAHTGLEGDGFVAVAPVDRIIRIRDRKPTTPGRE